MSAPTLCQLPFAIGEIVRRNQARDLKRRRRFFGLLCRSTTRSQLSTSATHRVSIGRETIESNLPLR
jgi:hypothetical protein